MKLCDRAANATPRTLRITCEACGGTAHSPTGQEENMWKPRTYCTQPRNAGEGCETCSLVNYGRDCHNEPIPDRSLAEFFGSPDTGEPVLTDNEYRVKAAEGRRLADAAELERLIRTAEDPEGQVQPQ